jgi:hypothetical protein
MFYDIYDVFRVSTSHESTLLLLLLFSITSLIISVNCCRHSLSVLDKSFIECEVHRSGAIQLRIY